MKGISIPNRVTQLALKSAIGTLKFLTVLGKGLRVLGSFVIAKPARIVGRILVPVLRPLYRVLFIAKHKAMPATIEGTRRPSILSILTGKYLIHVAVIVLTIGATVSSVSARGTGMGDLASGSILSAYNKDENTQDVVERSPVQTVSYVNHNQAISPEVSFEAELGADPGPEGSVADTGDALQIPSVGSDTVTQRSDVTTYVVANGDTIGGIANRFAVTQKTILAANNLSNANFIKPGQELLIPPITGVMHKVVNGDTLASIASKYKVSAQDIMDFNHIADSSAISSGQTLIVPGGEIPDLATQDNGNSGKPTTSKPAVATPSTPTVVPPSAAPVTGGKLNWPTINQGINQYFHYGHTGIDAECHLGQPLYAAANGTVEAVLYQNYGYGYHIIIDHGNNFATLYGHSSKIFVKPGQHVTRGQTIALCGSTGRSTGPHVHFETRVNGTPVNPLKYL